MRIEGESDMIGAGAPCAAPPQQWHVATRVAFRFAFLYFSFYLLVWHLLFGVWAPPMALQVIGVGATLGTVVWSLLDRRRAHYMGLQKWLRLVLRVLLGAAMLAYGLAKVFLVQMPFPTLSVLLQPYGQFSLMGVLWNQMGASPAYQRITGLVETLAGVLLLLPGLALPGALVAFLATAQVFVLNMTYDVPVKVQALHLLLMSIVLLAPDSGRLINVIVLNRGAGPSTVPPLVRSRIGRRIAVAVHVMFCTGLAWAGVQSWTSRATDARNASKPPLYGIWNVETMTIDGLVRAPLITDYDRWRRVVIEHPQELTFQRMDDTFVRYGARIDAATRTVTIDGRDRRSRLQSSRVQLIGTLAFQQPSSERLVLEGDLNGRKVRMELRSYDRSNFRLVQNGFHWVQDYPVNR